jgi:phosphate transport system substrate-binding protein
MKNIFLIVVIIGFCSVILNQPPAYSQKKLEGQITLSGAFALYPMAVKWAEEFKKINPDVRIDISAGGAGKGMTDVLNNMVEIGMVSREVYAEEIKKGAFPIAVTKDAVVPVISAQNPALNDVLKKGLKKESGNNIWITGKFKTWSSAFGVASKAPMHVYTRSDACGAAEVWAKYFGKKQEDLLGSAVYGDPGLALAVKKDPLGIGFNNIGYAYDYTSKKQVSGIRVVPLDLNNNGTIEANENFYDSMDGIVDAIATGKYPSPPARELYFVTKGKPQNDVLKEFIIWVLSDGQKFVRDTGYINLSAERLSQENLKVK